MRLRMPEPGPSGRRQSAAWTTNHQGVSRGVCRTERATRGETKLWKTKDQPYRSASVT